jgi:hypothetical protein
MERHAPNGHAPKEGRDPKTTTWGIKRGGYTPVPSGKSSATPPPPPADRRAPAAAAER